MGRTCVWGRAAEGKCLRMSLRETPKRRSKAEGEDLDGDAALDGHSHAGADAAVDGVG